MSARLYVYYKVPAGTVPDVVAAATSAQSALRLAHPGLRTALLRRPEETEGMVTLMESYAGALTPLVEAAIAEAMQALPQPRHSERFVVLDGNT